MIYRFIHLEYLDTISSGDVPLRQTLLEMVQDELQTALPAMKQAFQAKDWETLHGISHKMKSTLAFAGNTTLTAANQYILSNLEENNFAADFAHSLEMFQQFSAPVLHELKKELDACQLT